MFHCRKNAFSFVGKSNKTPQTRFQGCGVSFFTSQSFQDEDSKNNTTKDLKKDLKPSLKQEEKDLVHPSLKDWIPPMRPISGDQGLSHLYYDHYHREKKNLELHNERDKMNPEGHDKDDIPSLILQDMKEEGFTEYMDIDDFDDSNWSSLEKILNQDSISTINNTSTTASTTSTSLVHLQPQQQDKHLETLILALQDQVFLHEHLPNGNNNNDDEQKDPDRYHLSDSSSRNDPFQHLFWEGEEEDNDDDDEHHQQHPQDRIQIDPSTLTSASDPSTNIKVTKSDIPDWLKTRRMKLENKLKPIHMTTPDRGQTLMKTQSEIPKISHTLLSSEEIITCLENLGGYDVRLIIPEETLKQYLGWDGMIVATATSYSHLRVMADAIVTALRERKLHERGVIGAQLGAEGGEDTNISRRKRNKLGRGGGKMDDGWMAVDCRNYIVHIQDEMTRKSVDLESLWSPGSKQARNLRRMNCQNEDALDDYVAEHPIPTEYSESLIASTDFWGDGKYRGGMGLPQGGKLGKGRWTSPKDERRKMKNRGRRFL